MAITELYTDAGTTIGATEYSLPADSTTLASITTDGVYQVMVDVTTLAQGDEYLFKVKEKVLSGSAQREIFRATLIGGPQVQQVWVSPTFMLMHGWDVTLQKIAGTDRSIKWSIRQIPNTITELYTGNAVTISTSYISFVSGTTTLQSVTTDGVYQVFFDAVNMTSGDEFEFVGFEKAGDTVQRYLFFPKRFGGINVDEVMVTPAWILMNGWDFQLKRIGGADRAFSWSIRQVT